MEICPTEGSLKDFVQVGERQGRWHGKGAVDDWIKTGKQVNHDDILGSFSEEGSFVGSETRERCASEGEPVLPAFPPRPTGLLRAAVFFFAALGIVRTMSVVLSQYFDPIERPMDELSYGRVLMK